MQQKKSTTLFQSLFLSSVIFCAPAWVLFLGGVFIDMKQQVFEGYVTRGGGYITCSAVDYDPRYGQICDGETEYVDIPYEFITLEQAIGEHFIANGKVFLGLLPIALFFGYSFNRQQASQRKETK